MKSKRFVAIAFSSLLLVSCDQFSDLQSSVVDNWNALFNTMSGAVTDTKDYAEDLVEDAKDMKEDVGNRIDKVDRGLDMIKEGKELVKEGVSGEEE